jgi:hypothetical protein
VGILPLEPKDDTILVVHSDGVLSGAAAAQWMQPIARRERIMHVAF